MREAWLRLQTMQQLMSLEVVHAANPREKHAALLSRLQQGPADNPDTDAAVEQLRLYAQAQHAERK